MFLLAVNRRIEETGMVPKRISTGCAAKTKESRAASKRDPERYLKPSRIPIRRDPEFGFQLACRSRSSTAERWRKGIVPLDSDEEADHHRKFSERPESFYLEKGAVGSFENLLRATL